MRRSGQVILTAVFLSAISSVSADGQEIAGRMEGDRKDSSKRERRDYCYTWYVYVAPRSGRHGIFHWGGGHTPRGAQSTGPRTGGFGNSLRTSAS